jgi:hypothetical protein
MRFTPRTSAPWLVAPVFRALGQGWVVFFLLLACAACSVRLDPNRQQCARSDDCTAQGFSAAACVEGLCQPLSNDAGHGSPAPDAALAGPSNDASTADATAPLDAEPSTSDASQSPSPDASHATDANHATYVPDANHAPDASEAGACTGPECPQCTTDDDCARRGVPGASCVDSVCWAPKVECSSDAECLTRGPEYEGGRCLASSCRPNPRWRCEREQVAQDGAMHTLSVLVRDSLSLDPMIGVKAVACHKLDLQCAAPIAESTANQQGDLVLTLPGDFAGFLQIQQPGYFPAMYFVPAAHPTGGRLQPFPLLPSGVIGDVLALALGKTLDARRGHMMLISEDCSGAALAGVTFKSPQQDADTAQFYVQDLLPSVDAKLTGEAGNGGYLNFPPGTAMISVTGPVTNLKLATVAVVVRPGFITVAYIRPETR